MPQIQSVHNYYCWHSGSVYLQLGILAATCMSLEHGGAWGFSPTAFRSFSGSRPDPGTILGRFCIHDYSMRNFLLYFVPFHAFIFFSVLLPFT